MNLSYDILFTVRFTHNYFSNERTSVFSVSPSSATAEYMRKEGLIWKPRQDGFIVLFDRSHCGAARSREQVLATGESLLFYMVCKDSLLCNYTNLPQEYLPGKSLFYFTNRNENKDGKLHTGDYVAKEDICRDQTILPGKIFSRPLGVIHLILKEMINDEYLICFTAKTTYWRYVLVSDYVKELQQPAILDKENRIAFTGPSSLALPDKKNGVAFISESQLVMSQQPGRDFRLVENYNAGNGKYKVVLQRLPYPDIRHFSAIGTPPDGESHSHYSNIII